MATGSPTLPTSPGPDALPPAGLDDAAQLSGRELERVLGRTLAAALDFANWEAGASLLGLKKGQEYLKRSIRREQQLLAQVRDKAFPALESSPDAPAAAGVHKVTAEVLKLVRGKTLAGELTAVRGASVSHHNAAADLVSVGVCLTRYDGHVRTWRTEFFRHDCDLRTCDIVEEIRATLNHRARRSRSGPGASGDPGLTRLLRRALQSAAERKSLLEKTDSRWCIGYGVPAPYDLLTGSGSMDLIDAALPVLEELLLAGKRWVFVSEGSSNQAFNTLAAALKPGQELGIFVKAKPWFESIVDRGHYPSTYRAKVRDFAERAGEAIVLGGFRATEFGPPQLFFAPAARALQAGLVAMADAALQPHRGFPLLLELAGVSAKAGLGVDAFQGMVQSAYATAGAGAFYAPESVVLPQTEE